MELRSAHRPLHDFLSDLRHWHIHVLFLRTMLHALLRCRPNTFSDRFPNLGHWHGPNLLPRAILLKPPTSLFMIWGTSTSPICRFVPDVEPAPPAHSQSRHRRSKAQDGPAPPCERGIIGQKARLFRVAERDIALMMSTGKRKRYRSRFR